MQTVETRRSIRAPIEEVFDWIVDGKNWASVSGMFYSRVHPTDGPEPYGVGSVREFASWGSKVTELVTAFERPRYMRYRALSTVPPTEHDEGSISFEEIPGGTEVVWTTTGRIKTPVLGDFLTRLFGPLVKLGMVRVTRAAERALTP